MSFINEDDVEQDALSELRDLGWDVATGAEISEDAPEEKREREKLSEVLLTKSLRRALTKLNPGVPAEMLDRAIRAIGSAESKNLLQENFRVHKLLTTGLTVGDTGQERATTVNYIDFKNPENNSFFAVSQFSLKKNHFSRRMDIVLFVNGIPMAVVELKSPSKRWATTKGAYRQLETYRREFPELFTSCAIQVIGDGMTAVAGTVGSPLQHFAPWKTIDSEDLASEELTELQVLIRGMFDKGRFLDLVRNFVSFTKEDIAGSSTLVRKGAKYHQFWAVNAALESAVKASSEGGDGRGGIVWHTQGSGKSLEMLFLAGKLSRDARMKNPTIVVLTDRNDLDDQLFYEVFAPDLLLPEKPKQATSARELKKLLKRPSGGIVFTTLQKFRPEDAGGRHIELSDRRNIVVIADEAHRSQYDVIDGFARHLRDALPNATFIGFTGTPIEDGDRSTREIFGDYSSVYDITRAIKDDATVRIFYESRLAKVSLNAEALKTLDADVEHVLESEEDENVKSSAKSKWARQAAIVGSSARVNQIAEDIVAHWEQRSATQVGKAMVVCMSRQICVDLYNAITALRPDWHDEDPEKGKMKVVITGAANDPESIVKHAHNKETQRLIKRRAKKVLSPQEIAEGQVELEIVIVRDMWLTGFDSPSMHTMYVDKPMKGHSLMQAVARVNRKFRDKEGGLIVDYIGIAGSLRSAVAHYSKADRDQVGIDSSEFVKVALEKHDIIKGILTPVKWDSSPKAKRKARINTLARLVKHVLSDDSRKKRFVVECRSLLGAFAIAGTRSEVKALKDDVNLFAAVYNQVVKMDRTDESGEDSDEAIDTALKQLIDSAVASEGVVDLFGDLGLQNPELSVLSPEFLTAVKDEKPDLQLELMKKILNDKLREMRGLNRVKSAQFSRMLADAIERLNDGSIDTAVAVSEMVKLAEEMLAHADQAQEMGLSPAEMAFYDAVVQNGAAVLELGDDVLRELTLALVEVVGSNSKLDWDKKESVKAEMRTQVKRLLMRYQYPPDRREDAVELVIEQAELLARSGHIKPESRNPAKGD